MAPAVLGAALALAAAPGSAPEPAVLRAADVAPGWVVLQLSTPTPYTLRADGPVLTVDLPGVVVGRRMKSLWSARGEVRELYAEEVPGGAAVTIRLEAARAASSSWNGGELAIDLRGPAPSGRWRAQLGSFLSQEEAAKLESELDPALGNVEVRRVEVGGETRYRVYLGPFPTRAAARSALRRSGREGFLRFD